MLLCGARKQVPTVIIVTHFAPSDIGHGGNHRSYQIFWDCQQAVGPEKIILVSLPLWWESVGSGMVSSSVPWKGSGLPRIIRGVKKWGVKNCSHIIFERIRRGKYNFWQIFSPMYFSDWQLCLPAFLAYYKNIISTYEGPAVCIIEHRGFHDIVKLNRERGIPTISCIHNIESLDEGPFDFNQKYHTWLRTTDLLAELSVLSECTERLFISKIETGFVGGLGLRSRYYPYRPVGAIAKRLLQIHRKRMNCDSNKRDPDLFLMLGSAAHTSSGRGFRWFLENACTHGLPDNVKVEVVGNGTDRLETNCMMKLGIRCRGWVSQDELDALLVSACGVLIPQAHGFGALTRLPEISSAGIPIIVSEHATHALDMSACMRAVTDDWTSWHTAMEELRKESISDDTWQTQEMHTKQQSILAEAILGAFEKLGSPTGG